MTDPRPTTATPEMRRAAASQVVENLIKNGHLEASDRIASIDDIVKHGIGWMDGYELAKKLDDYCRWDCNFEMAEELDSYGSLVDYEIRKAEKAWAQRVRPEPPHPVGARIRTKRGEPGVITGIYEHEPAKYLVRMDDTTEQQERTQSRRIVNFEDAAEIARDD